MIISMPKELVAMPAMASPLPVTRPWLLLIWPSAIMPKIKPMIPVKQVQAKLLIPNTKLAIALPLVLVGFDPPACLMGGPTGFCGG